MIIACPSCETTFDVDSDQIGTQGRHVRCGACGHRWHQAGEPGTSDGEPTGASALEPEQAPSAEVHGVIAPPAERLIPLRDPMAPEPEMERRLSRPVLALAAALVLVSIGGAILLRDEITQALPASRALYALLGLAPADPFSMLEVANLANEERSEGGRKLLAVSGVVFNRGGQPVALPSLLIVFTDAGGRRIEPASIFQFKESEIAPGENLAFRAEAIEMPAGAASIGVELGEAR